MRLKLTKAVAVSTPKGARPIFLWDAGDRAVKGFGLKIMPSNHRSFVFQYRMAGGRLSPTRRYTIGEFQDGSKLTVEAARDIARGLAIKVRQGVDPIEDDRQQAKGKIDAKTAALNAQKNRIELVIERHLKALASRPKTMRSLKERTRLFKAEIAGTNEAPGPWRGRLTESITRRDISDLLQEIVDRGAPYTAIQVLAALRPFFSFAITKNLRANNPAEGVRLKDLGAVAAHRKRALNPVELRAVMLAAMGMEYPYGPLIRLLALTAQRRSEVSELDAGELAGGAWTIPAERAKNDSAHLVHLHQGALAVLNELPRKSGLLFSVTDDTPPSSFTPAKRDLDKASGVTGWTLHDLRRTFATISAEALKIPPHILDKILNHKTGTIRGVAAVYQQAQFLDERKAALRAWDTYVGALLKGDGSADACTEAARLGAKVYRDALA